MLINVDTRPVNLLVVTEPTFCSSPSAPLEKEVEPNLDKPRLAIRYAFGAAAELTNLKSGEYLISEVSEVGESGCFVKTARLLSPGTRVSLKVHHNGAQFVALGMVTYSRADQGMGIVYEVVLPKDAAVLTGWLLETSDGQGISN